MVSVLLINSAIYSLNASMATATVTSRVRAEPSIHSKTVTMLNKNSHIEVLSHENTPDGDWCGVPSGYVFCELLNIEEEPVVVAVQEKTQAPLSVTDANATDVNVTNAALENTQESVAILNETLKENIAVVQEAEIDDGLTHIDVTMQEFINEVVQRNSNMLYERLQTGIVDSKVKYEEGIFDTQFSLSGKHQDIHTPNNTEQVLVRGNLGTNIENSNMIQTSVSGLLKPGTQWSTGLVYNQRSSNLIDKYKNYDKEYDSNLEFSLRQPLLKGFGEDITMSNYYIARADQRINEQEYKKKLMDVMGMAIYTYWKLYGAQKLYDSWNESLKADKKLLLVIEERFKNGDAAKTEVLEAKSDILYREAEVINMRTKLKEVHNDMLTLLNVPVNQNEAIKFTLLDKPDVNGSEELLTLEEYFQISLENWPEFMITTEKIKREEIKKRYAQNQTSAQLDLTAKAWLSGLDDNGRNALRDTVKTDFTSWYVGFEYSVALFEDHKAINQVKISRLQKQQIELEYQSLYKGLYNALSTKLTKVIDSKNQLTLYLDALEIKDELLTYTRNKLEMGEASVRELILQEEDQINYHRKMFQTMLDWKYAQIALDKSVGTLFDKYYSFDDIKQLQPTRYDDVLTNDAFGQRESKGELMAEISLFYDKESDFEKSLKEK